MQNIHTPSMITIVCLMLIVVRSISGYVVGQNHSEDGINWRETYSKDLKQESVLMDIAKSLIGSKNGATTGQSLSLNMSNIVLMLVLRGLIWGFSYMKGGGKEARGYDDGTSITFWEDMVTETDVMLFLGYLVADESGHDECLNRVACEQPAQAEKYLRSGRTVWKTAKMLDGVIPLDMKYERILIRLEEAVENGRAFGDCQSKYKCFGLVNPTIADDHFDLT